VNLFLIIDLWRLTFKSILVLLTTRLAPSPLHSHDNGGIEVREMGSESAGLGDGGGCVQSEKGRDGGSVGVKKGDDEIGLDTI
jgi:hypothetical protein